MKNILLAGGGTAGHVTPHLALLLELEKNFDNIYYIGSGKEIESKLFEGTCVKIFNVNPPAFVRSLSPKNALIPFKLYKSVKECEKIIDKIKPSVIFSKGGYCALPVCLAGFKAKIPVICHESDLSIGLANKLCISRSTAFLTTFENALKGDNCFYCGPILRSEFKKMNKLYALRKLGITNGKPTLLVTGGSQGSKTINQALGANIEKILSNFNVIHLYGKKNKPVYKSINGYFAYPFADMPTAMSASDIAISRGGSNTLFELVNANLPALIVPLKKGSRGDQIKNAEYFKNRGAVMTLDESLLKENFIKVVDELYKNRKDISQNQKNLNLKNGREETLKFLLKYGKNN